MALIGAHVSVAGGLANGLIRAEELDITTIQIFGSSPRQWRVHHPKPEDLAAYSARQKARPVAPVFLHAPYMVNLATEDQEIWRKSVDGLIGHLTIAEQIQAFGLVFHVGSAPGAKDKALERVARGMQTVLEQVSGSSRLIVENSARSGHKVGVYPVELAFLIQAVDSDRVGVCLDTAHAFQSGLFRGEADQVERHLGDWDDKVGLDNLCLLHINDSATEFDSGLDRHANVGQGFIGREGFCNLARRPEVNQLPWILEVPGFDGQGPDRENIELLKDCFKGRS